VSFDFRPTAGGLAVVSDLAERIRAAREYPAFMRLMARSATGFQVALGFRDKLAVAKDGNDAGKLDLKHGAIIPLVNLVRFHALANGVTISPTQDRIEAVANMGAIDRATSDALSEALAVITRVRFEHHASLIAAGAVPDNMVDPGALPPITLGDLRESLQVVRRAQKHLGVWAGAGR